MSQDHINREHKDRLFRLVFREKKDLLDLYNVVRRTAYTANRTEVLNLVLTEYDEQSHIASEKEISYAEGMERINRLIQCLVRDGRMDDVIRGTVDLDYQKTLLQEYQL